MDSSASVDSNNWFYKKELKKKKEEEKGEERERIKRGKKKRRRKKKRKREKGNKERKTIKLKSAIYQFSIPTKDICFEEGCWSSLNDCVSLNPDVGTLVSKGDGANRW